VTRVRRLGANYPENFTIANRGGKKSGVARGYSPEPERPGTRLLPTAREKPGRALVELLSQPVNSFGIVSCALAILDNADFHEAFAKKIPFWTGDGKIINVSTRGATTA
jgi:hypothetical protein